jgi:hypothetical protein
VPPTLLACAASRKNDAGPGFEHAGAAGIPPPTANFPDHLSNSESTGSSSLVRVMLGTCSGVPAFAATFATPGATPNRQVFAYSSIHEWPRVRPSPAKDGAIPSEVACCYQ